MPEPVLYSTRFPLGKTVEEVPWGTRARDPDAMMLITSEDVIAMLTRVADG